MDRLLRSRLGMFSEQKYQKHLRCIRRGVERETLRVGIDGRPSQLSHPKSLGSALTHQMVTTDFSEALLELITPPRQSVAQLMQCLSEVHYCVARALPEGEYLWASSMPCMLDGEQSVPIAKYGDSNTGMMKTVYRRGLANRYGRYMQSIAGIHYNFSMPEEFWPDYAQSEKISTDEDLATHSYMGLIRNCRRDAWLLAYLFGASPVAPESFVRNQHSQDLCFNPRGDHEPRHATTLRLGRMGYQSDVQNNFRVCTNSLREYITDLCHAILSDHPTYAPLWGGQDGELAQLGGGLLQIENEYYGVIRPKQYTPKGMPSLQALRQHGVAYVELRCLDLDPQCALGLDYDTGYFLDAFLLRCLLRESPPMSAEDEQCALDCLASIVESGRDPDLLLMDGADRRSVMDWGEKILEECYATAEVLDTDHKTAPHRNACRLQSEKLRNPAKTPAARIVTDMREQEVTHFEYIRNRSMRYTKELSSVEISKETEKKFALERDASLQRRADLEQEQRAQSFTVYKDQYYQEYRNVCKESGRLVSGAGAI
jgi:glutamate--cysteine ligase